MQITSIKAYHGTTKENEQSLLSKGFDLSLAKNYHFGIGVYLTTTKKRAKAYGAKVITVELADVNLKELTDYIGEYKALCEEAYHNGVPAKEVNSYVGNHYKTVATRQGYDGLILDVPLGSGKEIVLYNLSKIKDLCK